MRTRLQTDDDVLESARQLAGREGRSLGAVISELARRSLRPTPVRSHGGFPVFDVPDDAAPITLAHVERAMDEE